MFFLRFMSLNECMLHHEPIKLTSFKLHFGRVGSTGSHVCPFESVVKNLNHVMPLYMRVYTELESSLAEE